MSSTHGSGHRSAEAWARVQLLSGNSPGQQWEINSAVPNARVDVGSHPRCAWQVDAPGVAGRHFEFYWDGQVLWAADLFGAGGVRIDGHPLSAWTALIGRRRIEFGQAAMLVDTSAVVGADRDIPPENPLSEDVKTRVALSPFDAAGPVSDGSSTDTKALMSSSELANQPTRMLVSHSELAPQATRLVSSAEESIGEARLPRAGAGAERIVSRSGLPVPSAVPVAAVPPPAAMAPPAAPLEQAPPPAFAMPPTQVTAVTKKQSSMRPRTWILLAATLAVSGYLIFSEPAVTTVEVRPTGLAPVTKAPAKQPAPAPVPAVEPAPAVIVQRREVDGGLAPSESPSPRRAVEFLLNGRLLEAQHAYEELAAREPDNSAYRSVVNILRRRLRAQCIDGIDRATGEPC